MGLHRCCGYKKGYLVKIIFFFNWKDVLLGGANKMILGVIFQYLGKVEVFFNIPMNSHAMSWV
jgi:hypothetical protein